MCKDNCGCKQIDCFPCKKCDECKVRTTTNCITVNNALPKIGSDAGEVLTTVLEMIDQQLSTLPPTPVISLTNIGTGKKVYKGLSNLGNYEFRTISAGSSQITVTETTDGIVIDAPAFPTPRTYSASNVGAGAGIYKDSTITSSNTQFNFKSIESNTLTIVSNTDSISINTPDSATIPALYVNSLYIPTYAEFLTGNTKGNGSFAKPFTNTINYTNSTTFTITPNTAIQNALDAYVGNGTRLNPQKLGQKIIIQSNNSTYTHSGDLNYNNLNLINQGIVYFTTSGFVLDLDGTSFNNNSQVVINNEELARVYVVGAGLNNSGNNVSTNTFVTGKTVFLIGKGQIIEDQAYTANKYLINSDPNGTSNGGLGSNNDGNLTFAIRTNLLSINNGVYNVGGLSRIEVSDGGRVQSGTVTQNVNTNLKAFSQKGGLVRIFSSYVDISSLNPTNRISGFSFEPTPAFPATFYVLNTEITGGAQNIFNKLNNNTVTFQISNCSTQYFTGTNLFATPNAWNVIFKNNVFDYINIGSSLVDLTNGNNISVVNTIGNNVIESLVRYQNRVAAQAVLQPYSAFINTKDNPINSFTTSAGWVRDITLPTS